MLATCLCVYSGGTSPVASTNRMPLSVWDICWSRAVAPASWLLRNLRSCTWFCVTVERCCSFIVARLSRRYWVESMMLSAICGWLGEDASSDKPSVYWEIIPGESVDSSWERARLRFRHWIATMKLTMMRARKARVAPMMGPVFILAACWLALGAAELEDAELQECSAWELIGNLNRKDSHRHGCRRQGTCSWNWWRWQPSFKLLRSGQWGNQQVINWQWHSTRCSIVCYDQGVSFWGHPQWE